MPTQKLTQFSCHYIYDDSGHDKTLVLSNSLGCTTEMWQENIIDLQKHFNILRYDNRGHGKSTAASEHATIEDLANDLLELIDILRLKNISFCGISIGGQIGLWLALNVAERFEKIIICNTAPKIGTIENWNERIEFVRQNGLAPLVPSIQERWFTEKTIKNQSEIVEQIMTSFQKTTFEGYASCASAVATADFREQLQSIQIPILIISGQYDETTTVEHAIEMQQQIANSRHVNLMSNHISNVDQSKEFTHAIIEFIKPTV